MKTFTPEEIITLEENLKVMKEAHADIKLADLNQDNIDELVELFNIIVSEYAISQGKANNILSPLYLEDLTEQKVLNLINIMNEAAEGLVEVAKENV